MDNLLRGTIMRTASELLRNLEMRIARLESTASMRTAALDAEYLKYINMVFPQTAGSSSDDLAVGVLSILLEGLSTNLDAVTNFKPKKGEAFTSKSGYVRGDEDNDDLVALPYPVVVGGSMVLNYNYDGSDFARLFKSRTLLEGTAGHKDLANKLFKTLTAKLADYEDSLEEATLMELDYQVRGMELVHKDTELTLKNLKCQSVNGTFVLSLLVEVESHLIYS